MQDKELTFSIGVALQIHYAARLLLLLNRPSPGGFGGYLQQQRLVSKYGDNICGIAMTLTDDASSILSSLCLYIGMAWSFHRYCIVTDEDPSRYVSAGLSTTYSNPGPPRYVSKAGGVAHPVLRR